MMGSYESEETQGIIPKAFNHIFGCIDSSEDGKKFLVRCSYLEIYNESILDLLGKDNSKKLDVKEDKDKGIYVKGLTSVIVKSIPEIEKTMMAGTKNRKVGETAMNKDSSRSHSIFTIYIETAEDGTDGNQRFRAGKLNLVDLAGSERQSKTHATGDRLKEAQKINLSLSALGNVISALVDGKSSHIPYRDSKLTRLLQDSLGGNTKTVMIAAISPADYNYDETLSTLRYASRAKNIKNKPKVNEDPKDALLRQYEDEIKMLKEALLKMSQGGGNPAEQSALLANLTKHFPHSAQDEDLQESIENIVNTGAKGNRAIMDGNHPSNSKLILSFQESENLGQRLAELEKLAKEKENIQGALAEKDRIIEMEAKQKEELQSIIKDMEQKLMVGGDGVEGKEKTQAKAYREFQLKLQKQKVKETRLKEEQLKREEELMTNLQDVQDAADEKGKLVLKLRKRYKAALNEIKDLDEEHQSEKSELLDSIRSLERDLDFYKSIVDILISENELYKIKAKSKYDVENNKWTVPPFTFKAQEVNFPKLNANRLRELVNDAKENNIVEFKQEPVYSQARQTNNFKGSDYNSSDRNSYENTGDSEERGMLTLSFEISLFLIYAWAFFGNKF
jgi:kinesin family protein 3/17